MKKKKTLKNGYKASILSGAIELHRVTQHFHGQSIDQRLLLSPFKNSNSPPVPSPTTTGKINLHLGVFPALPPIKGRCDVAVNTMPQLKK